MPLSEFFVDLLADRIGNGVQPQRMLLPYILVPPNAVGLRDTHCVYKTLCETWDVNNAKQLILIIAENGSSEFLGRLLGSFSWAHSPEGERFWGKVVSACYWNTVFKDFATFDQGDLLQVVLSA